MSRLSTGGVFDCIVVGAGIEGSATAYQFAKNKYKTLLLEQFPLPHSRGSSHGQSRIIRSAYEQLYFTHMVEDALKMWKQLENESNTQIFKKTGLLMVQEPPHDKYRVCLDGIKAVQRPCELYTGSELNQKYPGAVWYGDKYKGFIEIDAGLLKADKALKCFQEQFVRFGGTLQDETQVLSVIPGDTITVRTTKGQYRTKRIVLAVGPWASQMLKPLGLNFPLQCLRINVCYWKEKIPGMYAKFPSFIDASAPDVQGTMYENVYGIQTNEYPGCMKVCYHGGTPVSGPDVRERYGKKQEDINKISQYIRDHLPGLEDEPAIIESCMYTQTPDEIPIMGAHPKFANVAFVCGLSGTGFKLAPTIGKLMCELLTGRTLSHDLSHFSYERFNKPLPRRNKRAFQAKL